GGRASDQEDPASRDRPTITHPPARAGDVMSPERRIILGTTLRDGGQAPRIARTPDEKLALGHQLAKPRGHVLDAGCAASSPGDFEAVSRIASDVRGSVIASLARAHPDDIDQAYEALKAADRFRIHVFMSTSPIHMEKMLRMTPE